MPNAPQDAALRAYLAAAAAGGDGKTIAARPPRRTRAKANTKNGIERSQRPTTAPSTARCACARRISLA